MAPSRFGPPKYLRALGFCKGDVGDISDTGLVVQLGVLVYTLVFCYAHVGVLVYTRTVGSIVQPDMMFLRLSGLDSLHCGVGGSRPTRCNAERISVLNSTRMCVRAMQIVRLARCNASGV
jgi:hypothetical protein